MTEPTDLIARLRKGAVAYYSDSGPVYQGPSPLEREAADILASVTAERDEARAQSAAARENFLTMQGSAATLAAELTRLREALAREREECAKVAEQSIISTPGMPLYGAGANGAAKSIAAAIRSRDTIGEPA